MGLFDIFRKNKEVKKEEAVRKDVRDMSWQELRAVIGEVSDQNTLFEIAAKAPSAMDDDVRYVLRRAIPKIKDPDLLRKLAMAQKASLARFTVNTGVLPQDVLARVLKFGPDDSVMQDAAKYIRDEKLIADVLICQSPLHDDTYEYTPIVKTLIEKVNNIKLLRKIEQEAQSRWVASFARKKLPDEKEYIEILVQNRVDKFTENNIRGAAADELAFSKTPEAAEALLNAIHNDPAWNVRGRALTALGKIALSKEVPVDEDVFIDALKDPEKYVSECAIDVLGKMKCTKAVEPLLDFVRNYQEGQDFTLASSAIKALGAIGEDAVPVLLQEEKNGPANRGFVLRALAATGLPAAFDALKNGLADASLPGYEHEYIAKGLEKIGTEEAIACLKDALETAEDDGLVKTVAGCLERLNVPVDSLEEKKKAAEIKSAKKLLDGLKAIHPGMSEDEADDLVGPGVFQMGANVVHKTKYGEFQLLVTGGRVTGAMQIERVIANIEKWLEEQG